MRDASRPCSTKEQNGTLNDQCGDAFDALFEEMKSFKAWRRYQPGWFGVSSPVKRSSGATSSASAG